MKLLTAQWMREIDSRAIEKIGIPSLVLMENASRGAARWFRECFPAARFSHAVVLAGRGNNGGDGMAVARILADWNVSTVVCLMAEPTALRADSARQYALMTSLGIPVHILPGKEALSRLFAQMPRERTFIVDALLGIGIDRPVIEGPLAQAIQAINASGLPVAAVDVPSGLCESVLPGKGLCVHAACTATFHALKVAHLYPDGNSQCGRIRVVDIGIPTMAEAGVGDSLMITTPELAYPLAAPRTPGAHKKDFGHVLSIAGSVDKPGAGFLCAYAALRGGAGLSTLALPQNSPSAALRNPEIMTLYWRQADDLAAVLQGFDAIAVGPGLGVDNPIPEMLNRLLSVSKVPLILDADALNALAGNLPRLRDASAPVVITPHPGEFSRLTGWPAEKILADRWRAARAVAMENKIVVVLKGHHTVVASPQGRVWVNATGNPGMATAGSGDVLTGFIAAQVARARSHCPLDEICAAAVYLHGKAGDLAAARMGEIGMTAGDLLDELPAAIKGIHDDPGPFTIER
ncbi:MAG TPA: NAD(P)H-hydrate dehydratase [Candidatus Aminicenantes bacterium]|nr:NAD(P)H-hydrate dehydratase [Candidatus Aminicenantes bacterium]